MNLFCNICGVAIRGGYVVYRRGDTGTQAGAAGGLVVCAQCERSAPRCAACRTPMAAGVARDGLCATCAARLPRCSSCGRQIRGAYMLNAANGAIYCQECFDRQPHCAICGGAVGQGGGRLSDGRYICAACRTTAVFDDRKAEALYGRVTAVVQQDLGLRISIPPALALVDDRQMLALLAQNPAAEGAQHETVFGLFTREGRKRTIYVETGLPQILMTQVLAHEYAHAWQGENCPLLCDPMVREGFAEWVSYRALLALGAVKKAALMQQRTDLYGQGLQMMQAAESAGGVAAVLAVCRRTDGCEGPAWPTNSH